MKPLFKPQDGETIKCLNPAEYAYELPLCRDCGQVGYRIVSIRALDGSERIVPLCVRHYIKACVLFPELDRVSRQR